VEIINLNIKPLSINEAFRGRRFKSQLYKTFEASVLYKLPILEVPEGKLEVEITFGFSNKGADLDNPAKMFIDCLQKKYGFNDNNIYKLILHKDIVKKGSEYISFSIESISI
jgi:Holliday junction resolvase RusA-like endonuclease